MEIDRLTELLMLPGVQTPTAYGDLFFIYKTGHLMKLMCQKREGGSLRGELSQTARGTDRSTSAPHSS